MMTQNDIQTLIASLLKEKPGIQFDISGSSVEDQTVKIKESGTLDQSASQRTNVTLRVWNSAGRVGVVQLTSLASKDLLAAVDLALEAAHVGPSEDLPLLPSLSQAGELPVKNNAQVVVGKHTAESASIEQLAEALSAGVELLKTSHPSIQGVPYNALSQRRVDRFYANTAGLVRSQQGGSVSTYLYAKGQVDGYKPRAAGHWDEQNSLAELSLTEVAKVTSKILVSHLQPGKIPSGKYPVVFSGKAFLDLLDAFSNLFSAQNILDKQSLHSKDSLGQLIASELLNVTDDPLHKENISPALFDGEGTAVRSTVLVEHGRLKGLWHHSVSAKAFATQSTGHARVGAKMVVGPWFYNVAPGAGLGAIAENCIWVEEVQALHAGVNSLQGSFSLPFLGFRVENGQRMSLDGVTVAGDILATLKSIVALGEKQERASGGVCPAVAVASLSITCEL
ncbi:TldD/PmbA family protein [bacterium]|nr:TldD/PmbA family protein [bacterium]